MELALVVYLISILDSLTPGVVFMVGVPIFLISAICYGIGGDLPDKSDSQLKWFKRGETGFKTLFAVVPLTVILVWLAPDKETSYTMLAAYGVQTVAESEEVQQVMGKSVQVLEMYMDKYIDEELREVVKEPEKEVDNESETE